MLNTPLQSDHKADRDALARLIASGLFARSQNLEKILVYLCNNAFEGRGGVKEYHVATEALGRPSDFDPKKDSIVRVEMHRLRKRLREYYDAADPEVEPIRILIPEKSYTPEFRVNRRPDAEAPRALLGPGETALPPGSPAHAGAPGLETARSLIRSSVNNSSVGAGALDSGFFSSSRNMALLGVAIGVVAGGALLFFRLTEGPSPTRASQQTGAGQPANPAARTEEASLLPPVNPADVLRIMAGRPPGRYTDRVGQVWEGDRYFTGGKAVTVSQEIAARGLDPNIFAGVREGDFTYDIPLRPGSYELLLLFAETQYGERNAIGGGEAARLFSVFANGQELLREFDIAAEASDSNTATARRFRDLSPGPDGMLHLKFGPAAIGRPVLSALVISPGLRGRLRPIRITCRPESFRDQAGNLWEPDQFYRSGKQITRPQGAPHEESDLFRGERYGNFSYAIPVPPGIYRARLHFWEYWWGKEHPGRGGPGSRIFDVFCNHKPLLVDFDIIRSSAASQVSIQTFDGLRPNPQGKLVFDFTPKVNYAMVNAIEIVDAQPGN